MKFSTTETQGHKGRGGGGTTFSREWDVEYGDIQYCKTLSNSVSKQFTCLLFAYVYSFVFNILARLLRMYIIFCLPAVCRYAFYLLDCFLLRKCRVVVCSKTNPLPVGGVIVYIEVVRPRAYIPF